MERALGIEYIIKGEVLIEKFKDNDLVRLCTDNFIEGNIKVDIRDINVDSYYSIYMDSGEVEIYEAVCIDSLEEFNKTH